MFRPIKPESGTCSNSLEQQNGSKPTDELAALTKAVGHLITKSEIESSIFSFFDIKGRLIPFANLASKITLRIFREETKKKIVEIVKLFDLAPGILAASQKTLFMTMVKKTDPAILDQVTLHHLQLAGLGVFQPDKYLFCPDEEIYKMPLNTFRAQLPVQQKIILKRLELIKGIELPDDPRTIGFLRGAKGDQLRKIFPNPGETALELMSEAQIDEAFALSLFQKGEWKWLMENRPESIRSDRWIQQIADEISEEDAYFFPVAWVSRIDVTQWSDRRIKAFFVSSYQRGEKLGELSPYALNYVASKIDPYLLNSIPMTSRAKLRISLLSEERIRILFPWDESKAMRIFSKFPPVEINGALPRLGEKLIEHLSQAQLQGLDTAHCTQEQVDALFPNSNPLLEYKFIGELEFMGTTYYKFSHEKSGRKCSYSREEFEARVQQGWENLKRVKVFSKKQIQGFGDKLRPEHKKILEQLHKGDAAAPVFKH